MKARGGSRVTQRASAARVRRGRDREGQVRRAREGREHAAEDLRARLSPRRHRRPAVESPQDRVAHVHTFSSLARAREEVERRLAESETAALRELRADYNMFENTDMDESDN